jgi:hypothetical protein
VKVLLAVDENGSSTATLDKSGKLRIIDADLASIRQTNDDPLWWKYPYLNQ